MHEIGENQCYSTNVGSLFGWLKSPACIALFIFMLGAMVLTGQGHQQACGILLVLVFFIAVMIRSLKVLFPIPLEIKMLIAWVMWAGATGLLVMIHKETFWRYGGLRQVLQVLVLVIAVYGIARMHREPALKAMMFGIIVGGILQALVTQDAVQAGGGGLAELDATERAQGLTLNANTLGFLMSWAMLAAFMFWKQKRGKTHKIVMVGTFLLIPILCYGMLASGSRKSLVLFAFVSAAWFWYAMAPRKRAKAAAWKMGVIAAGIAISGPVSVYVMNNTLAGKRMADKLSGGDIVSAEQGRYWMYIEGLEMASEHPVFGVGINQYQHYSSFGSYSHSNYIEPLATTGIIGFVLYQGIFFIPLFRAWRLTKIIDDPTTIYQLKVIVVMCIAILLLGFGSPFYTSSTVMSFLALFSGYTHSILQQVRHEQHLYLEEVAYA